ncbi:MAG TPA: nuclease-related domain-containing protein [Thermomicrobiales bacterium]|nr:nuclease-related domain-containing protein [Thermomicrobiales bacterium]
MRIVRDLSYIKRRKRTARWLALLGFLLLASTFWIALYDQFLLLAYGLLLVGFVIFNNGMQQIGKWNRPVRNDQIIDRALSRLGDKYTLIHYATLGKQTIEHILVHPQGVLVLVPREIMGAVQVRGNRWRKKGVGLRRLFGMGGPQLGNPSLDVERAVNAVEKTLEAHDLDIPVDGAVVFTDPRADIEAEAPDWPILLPAEIPTFVRELPAGTMLKPTERQRVVELLSNGETLETNAPVSRRRPVKRRAA